MITIQHQVKTFGPKRLSANQIITAEVRHDDECGNGHNSFGVTADIYEPHRQPREPSIKFDGKTYWLSSCGCQHGEVVKAFPELAPLLKWHLSSTDGPLYYIANAKYWAGLSGFCDGKPGSPPNEQYLKSTIVYGALLDDSQVEPMALAKESEQKFVQWLETRLPHLLAAFQSDVESLGFKF